MTSRPILFSGPMVRALLAGTKTQTRRIVKPGPPDGLGMYAHLGGWRYEGVVYEGDDVETCQHGISGDKLWVRETWSQPTSLDPSPVFYRADYPACVPDRFENVPQSEDEVRWRPSIHMPRWASRIELEITDVRAQRLQDITEEDAIAEGVERWQCGNDVRDVLRQPASGWWTNYALTPQQALAGAPPLLSARASFRTLWEWIHGEGSWNVNPWLWPITFKFDRIEGETSR